MSDHNKIKLEIRNRIIFKKKKNNIQKMPKYLKIKQPLLNNVWAKEVIREKILNYIMN